MATLIMSAKLNDTDPQAWLADVLANIADTPISRLEQLLPWNWMPKELNAQAAKPAALTVCLRYGGPSMPMVIFLML